MRRFLVALALVVAALAGGATPVQAYQSDGKQFVSADNVFYAYVKAGEKLSASFLRDMHEEGIGSAPRAKITITIDAPGMKQQKCVLAADVAVGKGCVFPAKAAKQTGIWRISFLLPKSAPIYDEVSPAVRWGKNFFAWNITVLSNKDKEQTGRLWTERYAFRQPSGAAFIDDFKTYYISEDGYIYRAIEHGYNGQLSTLSADSIGIRRGDECISAYQSAETSDVDLSPALGVCGNKYKLFFEEPAGNLPASALLDGKDEWIRPTISKPQVSELHFNADDSKDQLSGTISYFLHSFIGQYDIKIDVDNDGSFDGQNDVVLHQQMKQLDGGLQNVRFSGVDKTGHIIPPSATIGIKVEITKVAEIHFIASDVEGRRGLEVVRLNGENAPTTKICWNDSALAALTNVTLMTEQVDGQSCPTSDGGVHGWPYNNQSWGNARFVEDWIYASVTPNGKNQIVYPEESEAVTKNRQTNWVAIIAISAVALLVIVAIVVWLMRRGKGKGGNAPQPPQQTPPGILPTPPTQPGGDIPPSDPDRY